MSSRKNDTPPLANAPNVRALTIEYPSGLLGRALGKNGEAQNAALRVIAYDQFVRFQPVTRRAHALQEGWIEIPRDPYVLRQMKSMIEQAIRDLDTAAAVWSADDIDLATGEVG